LFLKELTVYNFYPKNYPTLKLQVFLDLIPKTQELFNEIQAFAVLELKIQVIPIENKNDLVQYLEKKVI
jgi:hypothetical protein